MKLDLSILRDGKAKETVPYLNELRVSYSTIVIYKSLNEAIEQEYLQPHILSVFLPWSRSLEAIASCVQNGTTRSIRKQGIKHFGRTLADSTRWESAWKTLGDTKGLVDIFAKLSVAEVKALATAIGCCNHGQHKIKQRESAIENLLRALLPTHHSQSKIQSQDRRHIQGYYAQMVPACSSEFVEQLLDTSDHLNPLYSQIPFSRLIKTHETLLRRRVAEHVSGVRQQKDHLPQLIQAFVHREPPIPGPDRKVSASMAFSMQILQLRLQNINNEKCWESAISEAEIVTSILRRSFKKKMSDTGLQGVFSLSLRLLDAKPTLKHAFQSNNIWSKLIIRWKKAPEKYNDLVAEALRLGLSEPGNTIGREFLKTLRLLNMKPNLRPEQKWSLLRLFCLHVPKSGTDLDKSTDFTPLRNQSWPIELFYELEKEHAIRLLQGLYDVNPEYNFLDGTRGTSILSKQDNLSQRNFNVVLLLTLLQRESSEIQKVAENAVDELRKQAVISREQQDRAQFAKAASYYAIATGNLDLYAKTIIWQQRFVRDPLTVKVIFGVDAVVTTEAVELLSGIPQPWPTDMTLEQLAVRVKKANDILISFHETMRIAKREPSFYQPDWNGMASLFGKVVSERVSRAQHLLKSLGSSEFDVYASIWEGTLAMLHRVNVNFLQASHGSIISLLSTLPPTALATTTRAMLDAGNERRKMEDREPGDDILESLSYRALLMLTRSDKPELAQQLVLQTILDRPDASSWHRQLLSVRFLKSLPAKDAHEILLAFATAIGEKLEEQSYVKVGEPQQPKSAPPQSLVKVTTVKYLAQLLDNAEFISAEAAIDVLVELFKAGTHRDIRLATLDSLLSLLNNLCSGADEVWRSNPLVEKIVRALETVIPVAGSINERRPPRLEDWREAEETGTLPEMSETLNGLPPLMSAIMKAPDGQQYPGLKNMRSELVKRLLLPVLEYSQKEHRRWVEMFLTKHKVNLTVDDLPPTPLSPQAWDVLIAKYPDLIPQTVFENVHEYTTMSIAQPSTVQRLNRSLKSNVNFRNTPETRHWISIFDQKMTQYSSSATETLVGMIHHATVHRSIEGGISYSKLVEMIMDHASLLLDNYENFQDVWNNFVEDLRHPTKATYPSKDADEIRSMVGKWQQTGRPVLKKVAALVLHERNKQEQLQKRNVLPSASKLQIWLLRYPCFPDADEIEHECQAFANELTTLLNTILKSNSDVLRWRKLIEDSLTVSQLLNTEEERLIVAYYIGEVEPKSSGPSTQLLQALNFIRVTLAMKLIEDGRNGLTGNEKGRNVEKLKGLARRLKKRIEEWQIDPNEAIRERVMEWKKHQKQLIGKLMREE